MHTVISVLIYLYIVESYSHYLFYPFVLLDMRKALSRDVEKKSVIPYTQPVRPEDIDAN